MIGARWVVQLKRINSEADSSTLIHTVDSTDSMCVDCVDFGFIDFLCLPIYTEIVAINLICWFSCLCHIHTRTHSLSHIASLWPLRLPPLYSSVISNIAIINSSEMGWLPTCPRLQYYHLIVRNILLAHNRRSTGIELHDCTQWNLVSSGYDAQRNHAICSARTVIEMATRACSTHSCLGERKHVFLRVQFECAKKMELFRPGAEKHLSLSSCVCTCKL